MKKLLTKAMVLLLTISLSVGSLITFGGCGELKEVELIVSKNSIKTEYNVGEIVDFTGLIVTVKFNDGSTKNLEPTEYSISDVSTASAGIKKVTVSYKKLKGEFTITVSSISENETHSVTAYEKPINLSIFETNTKNAGKNDNFESEFFANESYEYVVGDDNAFKFLPKMTAFDDNNIATVFTNFESESVIELKTENNKVALTPIKNESNDKLVDYKNGEDILVTANTIKNEYKFTEAAIGKTMVISVKPSSNFDMTLPSNKEISITVTVVDGFNVYTAKDLSVLERNNDNNRKGYWQKIKTENGITENDCETKAIILQNDIKITKNDIPEYFYYTLNQKANYTLNNEPYNYNVVKTNGDKQIIENENINFTETTSTYAKDGYDIYLRQLKENETFNFYGNYFTIDASQFPLVCSFDNIFDKDGYGDDFSNLSLIKISAENEEYENEKLSTKNCSFKNVNFIGNANRSEVKDSGGKLVYAGGLIFLKSKYVKIDFENVITKTFFIGFFPEFYGEYTVNKCKCYDSFQNAVFVYGANKLEINDSYLERAGGPLMILQELDDQDNEKIRVPKAYIKDSKLESMLNGEEQWFASLGVSSMATQIKGLSAIFASFNRTFEKNGKMNIICLTMAKGTTIGGNASTKAYVELDSKYMIDRINMPDGIKAVVNGGAPVFNIGNTFAYWDSASFIPVSGNQNDLHSFGTGDYLTLNYGGLGLILGYYPAA